MTAVIDTTIRRLRNLRRPSAAANADRLRARGEQVASLTIRDALSADIPALARLHVATWNATQLLGGARRRTLPHPDGTFSGTYGWRDLRRLAAACPPD